MHAILTLMLKLDTLICISYDYFLLKQYYRNAPSKLGGQQYDNDFKFRHSLLFKSVHIKYMCPVKRMVCESLWNSSYMG